MQVNRKVLLKSAQNHQPWKIINSNYFKIPSLHDQNDYDCWESCAFLKGKISSMYLWENGGEIVGSRKGRLLGYIILEKNK